MVYDVSSIEKQIINQSSSYYTEDTNKFLQLDLHKYQKEIQKLLHNLERWNRRTSGEKKEMDLKLAYMKIMEFRNYMLGENNQIQYRLYIRSDENLSGVNIVNISEKELMSVVNRDRTSLRLKQNLDAVQQEQYKDLYRQNIANKHMINIQSGLEHPSRSPQNYIAAQSVIKKYAKEHRKGPDGRFLAIGLNNLAYQDDTIKGKSAYTLKLFNRGWIYQAFDETIERIDFQRKGFSEEVSLDEFHKVYFTESLNYDNLVGFKGGDVGLAQIKANMASIMSKTTLIKYLKIIDNILSIKITEDGSPVSKDELKQYIISSFTDTQHDTIGETLDKIIDIKVNKIIKSLTN